jgi:hypothetical protein
MVILLFGVDACSNSSFNGGAKKGSPKKENKDGGGDATDPGKDPSTTKPRDGDGKIGEQPDNPWGETGEQPDPDSGYQAGPGEAEFEVGKYRGAVDIVWAIDNSSSMSQEAGQVNKNINAFMSHTSGAADLKLALISCVQSPRMGSGSYCVEPGVITKGGDKLTSIDEGVFSHNALAMIMAASCPANQTVIDDENTKICGVSPTDNIDPGDEPEVDDVDAEDVAGKLDKWYRPGTRKVFVVVTDDNAEGVAAPIFNTFMKNKLPEGYSVYGFVGLPTVSTCGIAKVGQTYIDMAKQTSGKSYNICEPDWSGYFDELSKSIIKSVSRIFTVRESRTVKITGVFVDGKKLAPADYIVTSNSVEIKEHITLNPGMIVKITFE